MNGEDDPVRDPYQQPLPDTPAASPSPLPEVPPPPSYPPAGPPAPPTSPHATWALVLGLLALLSFGPGPILGTIAIALGVLAHRDIRRANGRLGGRALATAGMTMGIASFAVFGGLVAAYVHYSPRWNALAIAAPAAPPSPSASASANATPPAVSSPDDGGLSSSDDADAPPLPTISTLTTIGTVTVIDVAFGIPSLAKELRNQRTAAAAHGQKLLLETVRAGCEPCDGVAQALGDPRMQRALDRVRLVRVDRDQFAEDLEDLTIPSDRIPGFFLIDSDLHVTDSVAGDEWDDDVATNIAPVLGPFLRGTYTKRRNPWKAPRPSGTVL